MRAVSAVALAALAATAGAAAWGTGMVVHDQEHRLLQERAAELRLTLSATVTSVEASLAAIGGEVSASGGSLAEFDQAAASQVRSSQSPATIALVRPGPGGYQVVAVQGQGLAVGQVLTGTAAAAVTAAAHQSRLVPTPVMGSGQNRQIGLALGPPSAPAGSVLYRQVTLGPVRAPRAASAAPFSELNVVFYAAPTQAPDQVLAATTTDLPLTGQVVHLPLTVGSGRWLLVAAAKRPLVGSVAANAPWFVLGVGLAGTLLVVVIIESAFRRRDIALALYATEHRVAETLQRNLLPRLPALPGVELAARYLAGEEGQRVGGDWFDAFPLASGGVGLVIGDVIGHDVTAATAMSQVRSAVRAYAWEGAAPAAVLDRLERLIDTFGVTQLVTVLYGVLDQPAPDGSRTFRFANAGHLPPLLQTPEGRVRPLEGGDSIVIGAPNPLGHVQAVDTLPPGSTLLLFTDGLVEMRERSLDATLGDLADTVAEHPAEAGADALCDRVLGLVEGRELRDDVALLAVRVLAPGEQLPAGDRGAPDTADVSPPHAADVPHTADAPRTADAMVEGSTG